jgi:transketolase
MLPDPERARLLPDYRTSSAIGITDFTLPTLHRFVTSERGRAASLHPFAKGRHLGSGRATSVLREAGLDAASQLAAVLAWARRDR